MAIYKIKRIYEAIDTQDGLRVLVDRLWPRGIKKENARVDLWLKDLAPSTELRKWFKHETDKWPLFQSKYEAELADNPALAAFKQQVEEQQLVTLLYAAHDEQHNNAQVLKAYLEKQG